MIAALLLAAAAPAAAAPAAVAPATPNRAAIETIVHDYILSHPEILPEAMSRLQARETAVAIATNRAAIFTPYGNAWDGAADADVTIVQFFDYDCGYCRRSLPDIDRLLAEDKKLRIVYREFPVLGPDSEAAAKAALLAARGRSYPAFHRALYAPKNRSAPEIARVATQFGVKLTEDPAIAREIDANRALARPLNLTGTPAWVVGDEVLSGAVGYDALKAAIAKARVSAVR